MAARRAFSLAFGITASDASIDVADASPSSNAPIQSRAIPRSLVTSRSGTSRAERRGDLLDGFCLRGTHALPSLPVGGSYLAGEGEDEAPVVIAFPGGRL